MTRETKKTKKQRLKKLFHSAPPLVKEENSGFNVSLMKKLVTTKEQEGILKRIEQETIPSVRDAWIEYFLKITKQPQCKDE